MISDLDLARACQDTYGFPPTLPVPITGVNARVTRGDDDTLIVAFRGSVTAEDWARDFIFSPIVDRAHPQLGRCHAGFLDGAESMLGAVSAAVGVKPFILTGHSLGGAIALLCGGLLICGSKKPAAIVTFGAPRVGMLQFAEFLAPYPVRQYRRGNDIVPLVPADIPPFDFRDTRFPLIEIGLAQRRFLDCHHIGGYVADVAARLAGQAAA